MPRSKYGAPDDSLFRAFKGRIECNRQSDRPVQVRYRVPYLTPGSVAPDLELARCGGKLFFYAANIFRFVLWSRGEIPTTVPVLRPDRCLMPRSINDLQICPIFPGLPPVGELDARFMASAHEHRIDNTD